MFNCCAEGVQFAATAPFSLQRRNCSFGAAEVFSLGRHIHETISRMKYRFGSNEMYIGKGIIRLLEIIKKRYGIDFSKVNQQESKNLSSYKARMIIAIIRAIILAIGSIFRYE